MAEGQAGLEPLHQSEDVALCIAGWIPPAASSVANDQDLAFASSVLQAELRALLPIQFQGGGVRSSTTPQCTLSRSSLISGSCPVMSAPRIRAQELGWHTFGFSGPCPSANREAVALQGRAVRAGACDTPLSARLSGRGRWIMAMECRSPVLWRRAARTGKRKARRSVQWLWPLIGPVGLGIAVACGAEFGREPQVVSPNGLPVQVRPTYPEPGLPTFSFPQGGTTLLSGAGSGTTGTQGTPGSSGTGTPGSTPASAATSWTISSTSGLTTAPTSNACR